MSAFLEVITAYQEITELTPTIFHELISEIRVGTKETVDGVKRQKIKIVYKHPCYVDYFEDDDLTPSNEAFAEFLALEAEFLQGLPEVV